jgi:hypothetical protein
MTTYEQRLRSSPQAIFEEASLYFMGRGDLYKAFCGKSYRPVVMI